MVLTSNWKNQIHVGSGVSDHFRRNTYGMLQLMSEDDCSYMNEDVRRICSLSLCVTVQYNCNCTL
jgi:hypothetical protein